MNYIALLLLILAAASCDDSGKSPVRSAPRKEDVRRSSAYWFPNMEAAPPIAPTLPDDFISGIVTNRYVGNGTSSIVWGRSEDIQKLNQGATITPPVFTISESPSPEGSEIITPANRQEFISNYAAMGYSDIQCGSRKMDGWTVDWVAGLRPPHAIYTAWLSKPDRKRQVMITLVAGEGSRLWADFIKPIERSEQVAPSDGDKSAN